MLRLRKNTVNRSINKKIININEQNLTGILGVRGSGKSLLGEALLERYFDYGFTCLDLWSAPNMEGCFWIFAKDGHKKRIPITILAPESFIIPETQIDKFNGTFIHVREPLVEFVKLPSPTKKNESEANEQILEILTETILHCREHRRILVFNPYMFPNETEMFRILEILMRNMITISNNYFHSLKPEQVGKTSKEQMTNRERNYHRMCFLMREFGEVAPARLKGDKSGESTLIKKALLKFVRLARHANIDGIIDYQNASDADSSIRNQIDTWLIKTWTPELGGENFKWVFRHIKERRDKIFDEAGFNDESFQWADSSYPPIEKLSNTWFYAVKRGDSPKLKRVPELHIRHKEPDDKWWAITGIPIQFDKKLKMKTLASPTKKSANYDEKFLYNTIVELKSRKGKEKLKWNDIIKVLSEMQENGDLIYRLSFNGMESNTISSIFSRLKTKFNEK
ncbi:MAG: hypothetical protein ACW9XH_07935 [Candidatus Nitrosopumilus sp. bin_32a]